MVRGLGEGEQGRASQTEDMVFCNLMLGVTSKHVCDNLFVRSESVGPIHIQGKGNTQGYEY